MEECKVKFFDAHVPPLDELVQVIQEGLKSYFSDVMVEVTDCPDFTLKPYKIAVSGLDGKPTIADVGGGKCRNSFKQSTLSRIEDHSFNCANR